MNADLLILTEQVCQIWPLLGFESCSWQPAIIFGKLEIIMIAHNFAHPVFSQIQFMGSALILLFPSAGIIKMIMFVLYQKRFQI